MVDGKIVGSYRIDFLIENKIIVEFKVRDSVYQQDLSQILYYLAFKNLRLGLLAHFTNNGVKIKRLIVWFVNICGVDLWKFIVHY